MNNSPLPHPPKLALSRFYLTESETTATHPINLSLCGYTRMDIKYQEFS